jgi:hypothetical protein
MSISWVIIDSFYNMVFSMRKFFLFSVVVWLYSWSLPAMAYIDPGSGSAIMSAIIGFFLAVSIAIKTYWYKLKAVFTKSKPTEDGISKSGEQE